MLTIVMNKICNAVFDSGANISIISYKLARQLNILQNMQQINSNFITINSQHKCLGLLIIPITIGEIRENHSFEVIEHSNYSLLLGLDIIRKFKLKFEL